MSLPGDYEVFVQTPLTAAELEETRYSVNKGKPLGEEQWSGDMIRKHGLDATTSGNREIGK